MLWTQWSGSADEDAEYKCNKRQTHLHEYKYKTCCSCLATNRRGIIHRRGANFGNFDEAMQNFRCFERDEERFILETIPPPSCEIVVIMQLRRRSSANMGGSLRTFVLSRIMDGRHVEALSWTIHWFLSADNVGNSGLETARIYN